MKSVFLNNNILLATAIIIGILGLLISYRFEDFLWFSRTGSIIVGIGIILISRTSFTGKDLMPEIVSDETKQLLSRPEHYQTLNKPVPNYVNDDVKNRKAIQKLSPIITFGGTIIWGFGDLLNCLFHFTSKPCQ